MCLTIALLKYKELRVVVYLTRLLDLESQSLNDNNMLGNSESLSKIDRTNTSRSDASPVSTDRDRFTTAADASSDVTSSKSVFDDLFQLAPNEVMTPREKVSVIPRLIEEEVSIFLVLGHRPNAIIHALLFLSLSLS